MVQPTSPAVPHISVCVCTYRRAAMLHRLLRDLAGQETGGRFTYSVVVADNDAERSAAAAVEAARSETALPIEYVAEPRRNIALARNASVAAARGEYIAFIDDDEFPRVTWLADLLAACDALGVDGVLGPVEPYFVVAPPAWVKRAGFYQRPRHATGKPLAWAECRTGNVLFRRAILADDPEPFRAEFGSGGEDQDFFRRMIARGCRFAWCDEAVVQELVPASRCRAKFLFRRALLRGRNTFRHPEGRWRNVLKSCLAAPAYLLALPFCLLGGFHLFMRYLVKSGDHAGRLLAVCRIHPVAERDM